MARTNTNVRSRQAYSQAEAVRDLFETLSRPDGYVGRFDGMDSERGLLEFYADSDREDTMQRHCAARAFGRAFAG